MYAKIFSQIYDSSIADDWQVRVVFEDCLILANPEGELDMTPEALSARTRIPLDVINRALTKLQEPDPRSRTPDCDGRRMVLLNSHRDWGWQIVNYEKYRLIRREFDRRSYMRKYMVKKRNGVSKTKSLTGLTGSNVGSTSPSPYPSLVQGGVGGENGNVTTTTETLPNVEFPQGFPKTIDDAVSHAAFVGCDPVFATNVWNKAAGRGGRDSKDVPVRVWRNYLAMEWKYERERLEKAKHPKVNGNARQPFISELKTQMEAVQRQIDQHPANSQSMNFKNPTDLERSSLKQLRGKIVTLNNQIANGGNL